MEKPKNKEIPSRVSNEHYQFKRNDALLHSQVKDLKPGTHHFPFKNRRARRTPVKPLAFPVKYEQSIVYTDKAGDFRIKTITHYQLPKK